MRLAIPLAALLLVPWSGCVAPADLPSLSSGLFSFRAVARGDPAVQPVGDCEALAESLVERARVEALVALDQSVQGVRGHGRRGGFDEEAVAMAAADTASAPAAPPAGGSGGVSARDAQVTGTNNQEAAADEADFVKTDGEWTYVLDGPALRILHSRTVGDVAAYATVDLGGGPHRGAGSLLLEARDPDDPDDDRLVAVLGGQAPAEGSRLLAAPGEADRYGSGFVRILVLSLADRRAPATLAEEWVEGDVAGARLVAGHAYVVVHRTAPSLGLRMDAWPQEEDLARRGLDWPSYEALPPDGQREVRKEVALDAAAGNEEALSALGLDAQLPAILRRQHTLLMPVPNPGCDGVFSTPESTGRGITTILAIALAEPAIGREAIQVVGGDPIVYASEDSLVLASPSQDPWWYFEQPDLELATDLQWLRLDGLAVTPWASGRVAGIVMDTFGLDVHGGALRVVSATGTYNRGWMPETDLFTSITVFDAVAGVLVPRGAVGGIAPGERLWSVRFTDARAYIVTFEGMDPLWVVDLQGPVPVILGELEVAGVSTYIHPLAGDRLLNIGYGGGDGGLGLDEGTILVSLFDVRTPSAPRQLDTLDLSPPGGGAWTTALHEHKAFTYWDAVGVLAVPVSSSGHGRGDGGSQVSLDLIDVGAATLSLRGAVGQEGLGRGGWGTQVERSYFLGVPGQQVSVYAVSPLGVTAHDLDTLEPQGRVAFR